MKARAMAERAEATDTARLDWMAERGATLYELARLTGRLTGRAKVMVWECRWEGTGGRYAFARGETPRAALDAAMRGEG